MPPAKRARPSFSPPRPGKSKTKSNNNTSSDTTATKKRGRSSTSTNKTKSTTTSKTKTKSKPTKRKRTPSPHNSSSARSSRASSPSHSEPASDNEPSPSDHDASDDPNASLTHADHLLVEITNADPPTPTIPLGLIHRIMLEHWDEATSVMGETEKRTKISGDAREVMGTYVETFVREAVARTAFEAGEREGREGGGGGGSGNRVEKGWLDVVDLERVGGGLVLDF